MAERPMASLCIRYDNSAKQLAVETTAISRKRARTSISINAGLLAAAALGDSFQNFGSDSQSELGVGRASFRDRWANGKPQSRLATSDPPCIQWAKAAIIFLKSKIPRYLNNV